MKKILCFIVLLATVLAAFTLSACGKNTTTHRGSPTDIVANIPYVSNFTCDYYAGDGFADYAERSTTFGSEDEVLVKLSFTLSPDAFKDGKRRLTIKPVMSDGFYGSIVSANTSSVNNTDLTAAYDVDDKRTKDCVIEFRAKFNHSSGELQIGYAYDGDEYLVTGSYVLLCRQSFIFTYNAEVNGYVVSGDPDNYYWLYDAERVEIPATFGGKPVTKIISSLFSDCHKLTDVEIPDSVTSIGYNAFSGCTGLTSIKIPDGVTSIESGTFWGCSSLASVTIPDSVVSIGSGAFYGCGSLTNITIPNGVTVIDGEAFRGCSSLTSVTIPDSVTSIGGSAFDDCNKLKYNEYGDAQYLGNEQNPYVVFIKPKYADAETITNIDVNTTTKFIYGKAFANCVYLTSITIPNSVTSIGDRAFYGCRKLTSITIPNGVTSIELGMFYDCSSLMSVTIPGKVTSIGNYAFRGCSSLTSITIPNSVTSVGDYSFYGCGNLTSATIPNSVTSIGDCAFAECGNLTSVTIPNSVTSIDVSAFV